MARHDENNETQRRAGDSRWRTPDGDSGVVGQGTEQERADEVPPPADGGGLRERTEQQESMRDEVRSAEAYAPPAGQGAKVNPDAQRNDPDGEATPTA